jgi:hypothetical protein
MDDGTNGWMNGKSFMTNDHDVFYYMFYCTSTYYVHTLKLKNIYSNLNNLNTFTKEIGSPNVETSSNKVKVPKVGSNVIILEV